MNDFLLLGLAVASGLSVRVVHLRARVVTARNTARALRRSLVAFELRLPRTATVSEVGRWVGRCGRCAGAAGWSILPRWPPVVETPPTADGVRRVLLVPSRLRADTSHRGARWCPAQPWTSYPLPHHHDTHTYNAAGEARLKALVICWRSAARRTRPGMFSSALQRWSGEVVRVQWVVTGARAAPLGHLTIHSGQRPTEVVAL